MKINRDEVLNSAPRRAGHAGCGGGSDGGASPSRPTMAASGGGEGACRGAGGEAGLGRGAGALPYVWLKRRERERGHPDRHGRPAEQRRGQARSHFAPPSASPSPAAAWPVAARRAERRRRPPWRRLRSPPPPRPPPSAHGRRHRGAAVSPRCVDTHPAAAARPRGDGGAGCGGHAAPAHPRTARPARARTVVPRGWPTRGASRVAPTPLAGGAATGDAPAPS